MALDTVMTLNFEKDKQLAPLTTFNIPATAALFISYDSPAALLKISRSKEFINNQVYHIGGGSNLLFNHRFNGLILHSCIKGITSYKKDSDTVFVIAGAAEKWTDLVDWCVENDIEGLECLAGIPGEVGASPVQNVGAYGVEAKDVIHNVECFDCHTRKIVTLKGEECGFGYRTSYFKNKWKGRYFVLRVSFRLRPGKTPHTLTYGPLKNLETELGHYPSIKEVRDKVIELRNSKLPDPRLIGNAGSFFKNPVVGRYFFEEEVLTKFPEVPFYELPDNKVKIPAGWLIENAGMKGASVGGAAIYDSNCLVIANKGDATYQDVRQLASEVIKAVNKKFSITLLPEVNYVSSDIEVTVLGSGTSKGIPEAACFCDVCTSPDPHDKRQRASILIETMGTSILIDASPDFRQQAIKNEIFHIDAVLITHSHADHVGGIDDLRPFCIYGNLPLYMKHDVSDDLHRRIDYCFREHPYPGVPKFDVKEISDTPFYINGIKIVPINIMHGKLPILGFRIGKFAYITDAKTIPEGEMRKLEGIDTLILNALRFKPHFSHLSIPEALDVIEEINPDVAYLTHLCHRAPAHAELEELLPENVHPAYDGLHFKVK